MDNIADKDDVLKRAQEILKRDQGIELSEKEMEELYDITAKFIKHKVENEPYHAVILGGLGRPYYKREDCSYFLRHFRKVRPDEEKEALWQQKRDEIDEYYQNNQTKKNVRKGFKFYAVIKKIWKKNKTKGYDFEALQEIQNNIQ